MIVYVVTVGTEKGRKIEAVFDDHKQAAYYCAVRKHEDSLIEEWDTDAVKFTGNKELLCCWCAQIDLNDEFVSLNQTYKFEEEHSLDEEVDGSVYVWETLPYDTPKEDAKKILLERLAKYRSK